LRLFRWIIEQARPLGLKAVKLTGGEPLLHPNIHDLLDLIRAEDLRLIVEINGVLCTPGLARKMAACKDPFVSVSLDGTEPETHGWVRGVEGCFESTLEGTRNLREAGLRLQVIMSIMRRNKDQMGEMARLSESLGANSVKFNMVLPGAREKQYMNPGRP
jgi:SynChlorMet cassette radical SAM/SPASM protein ScmF